jgi:hypothetical protein
MDSPESRKLLVGISRDNLERYYYPDSFHTMAANVFPDRSASPW